MILKYGGLCSVCKKRIPEGTDASYDGASKSVAHWECLENSAPDPSDYEKAESLGFRDYDELMKESE